MGRARHWGIAVLCVAAAVWPYLDDGALDALGASNVRWHQQGAPHNNCTALLLDRTSGVTSASRCPDGSSIHLEASGGGAGRGFG